MKIKSIRKLSNLSQRKFCERYNIPLSTLRQWEQGKREPPNYLVELLEFKVREDLGMEKTICKEYEVWLGGELFNKFKGSEKDKSVQCAKRISKSPDYIGSVWINEIIINRIEW